ncbi:choline transporter [Iodidimonas nitroreducens]|uniref:Choline transporter n=1 Tax=Iodidimonas nitroreducens TaxID=1236968 RepID=A0A5A7ND67_9PROT|nr:choline BCCT transporter BetT [Iodidimonas nitroreducens]GAK32265.1 high-affinity choline transport protein [alpha proteobacterium Q-1]GER04876.1 choline transporter [Iodidimonas nitroreducens]
MAFWNWKLFESVNKPVFFISAFLIFSSVLAAAFFSRDAGALFGSLQSGVVARFGWLYVLSVAIFLVFIIGLAMSSFGEVRLGPDASRPDFSYLSWIAMLFSAGMGIGLMFFGVAEPISHYFAPPTIEGGTADAAREAMSITFFHWGLHAWAIYAVVGLSLAYFGYRKGLPLTIRSSLYPLLGERIYGPIGHAVDIMAVVSTLFGVATSLGVGVMQVNAGLNHLFGLPDNDLVHMLLIISITAAATISVVAGLDAGIKRLSEINMILAVCLLLFVLLAGPTLFLLQAFVQNLGGYFSSFVSRTFSLYAYEPNDWISDWTLFYWAWWIAWSPFVGMFIARISRGRTIREFVVSVLLVPSGFTFLWMTVFGNSAILFDMEGVVSLGQMVVDDMPVALFQFLEALPLSAIASFLGTGLAITFFITSSDSGSLVIDIITSGGDREPPVWQRVFWAVTEGVVAAILLLAGGLAALQAASLISALPFTLVILAICWGLYQALRDERARKVSHRVASSLPMESFGVSWKQRLRSILQFPKREQAEKFLADIARPALLEVMRELKSRGMEARVEEQKNIVRLIATNGADGSYPFDYAIYLRSYEVPGFAMSELKAKPDKVHRFYRAEVYQSEGGDPYDVISYSQDQLITDVITQYDRHRYYLHMVS